MQPDWVWLKKRDASSIHVAHDSVRGATKRLIPNNSDAETTQAQYVKSFDSNGITFGTDTDVNNSGSPAILWGWKAGTSVSGTTTGSGTGKAYSGSVNTNAGFSIISYLGNGTAGHTIPHHLGSAPKVVLCKRRTEAGQWVFGHGSLGFTKFLELDLTGGSQTSTLRWNDTAPTSSVFSVGTTNDTNRNDVSIIAYCFAEKKGYSKFGTYKGNGDNDGVVVHTGFKPAWVLYKKSSGTENWFIHDNKRQGFNPENELLFADLTNAEGTVNRINLLSNGFKATTSDGGINGSGDTYIYIAFAESPQVNSAGAVPNNAR